MGVAVLADSTIFARDGLAVDDADGVAGDRQFFVRGDGVGEQPGIIAPDYPFPPSTAS